MCAETFSKVFWGFMSQSRRITAEGALFVKAGWLLQIQINPADNTTQTWTLHDGTDSAAPIKFEHVRASTSGFSHQLSTPLYFANGCYIKSTVTWGTVTATYVLGSRKLLDSFLKTSKEL